MRRFLLVQGGHIVKTAALRIFAIGVGVVLLTSAYTRIHSASVMTERRQSVPQLAHAPTARAGYVSISPTMSASTGTIFPSHEKALRCAT